MSSVPATMDSPFAATDEDFAARGFLGPIPVLTPDEAHRLKTRLLKAPAPETWSKGCAATSGDYYEIAIHPEILDRVASILGEDVMLCGANLVEREPGQFHAWHSDVHLDDHTGRAVGVWLGLENVTRETALQILPGSHRYGFSPQERAQKLGHPIKQIGEDDVRTWAAEMDADAEILDPDMGDGDAIFFEGHLWHGSHNTTAGQWRTALLLHYATPDKPIRMHAPVEKWPFEFVDEPKPPCQMIRGVDRFNVNRIVPAPMQWNRTLSRIFDPAPILQDVIETGWRPDPLLITSTRSLPYLFLKVNALAAGIGQHEMHIHAEEQIVIPLKGRCTLDLGDSSHLMSVDLEPGKIAYLSPGTLHTMHNDSSEPSWCLDIVWRGTSPRASVPLGTAIYDYSERSFDAADLESQKRAVNRIIDSPTMTTDRLGVHLSELTPGRVGPVHVDCHDAIVVVLSGQVEALGQIVGPGQVIFFAAGDPHSLSCVGDEPARCIAVELQSTYSGKAYRSVRRWITSRLPRPVRQAVRDIRKFFRGQGGATPRVKVKY